MDNINIHKEKLILTGYIVTLPNKVKTMLVTKIKYKGTLEGLEKQIKAIRKKIKKGG